MSELFGGIEAGGTKFVCALARYPRQMLQKEEFRTLNPSVTIPHVLEFFHQAQAEFGRLRAIGIAAFGPLDLQPDSATYGYITSTPKPGWANFDLLGAIRQHFDLPLGFDTDVNSAALAEWRWGAARGLDTFVYLTIGTGIGGGGMVSGKLIHGLVHPEMGHICLPHDYQADPFPGICPFHGDCLEGMASGPAIEKRWGQRAETLPADHLAWEIEAQYLAFGIANFICILSPQRVIMGGGVMKQMHLFPLVRLRVQQILNQYVNHPAILTDIDQFIVPPSLGSNAGVLGAIALAQSAVASD